MKYRILTLIIVLAALLVQTSYAQTFNKSQLAQIDVDNMTDEQIAAYWDRAKSEGYTLDQLEIIAKANGVPASQISKLRQRIQSLNFSSVNTSTAIATSPAAVSNLEKFGLEGKVPTKTEKSLLFGYDFFSNPNISFTPNLNLATPANYQIGPGDELLIDIWGAAENNYKKQVNRDGAIRIENIGPVYVSGLSIEKAKEKITSYLRKIYSGIGAPAGSYNKVYAEVSLTNIRTVQVNIIGEVKVPGTYALSALSTVLNGLYAAGGPTEKGTFRSIKVVREGKNLKEFDIYNYLIQGSEEGNITLQDQDIIIVQPYTSIVEVTGNVKRPGLFELKQGETFKDLAKYFSGFTAAAYQERILVERINGKQKEVTEILTDQQATFKLQDGDKIAVGTIVDRYENRVSIVGSVYRPGNYELTEGMTLLNLIEKASGLRDDAFLGRGLIFRTIDDTKQEIVPFAVQDILDKKLTITLKREDKVEIFNKHKLKEEYTVDIWGAVNNPQAKVPFVEKMQIEDLIAIAGGFQDAADLSAIDISRRVNDSSFKIISKVYRRSSTGQLQPEDKEPFYLEPFDVVSVRFLPGYSKRKLVTLEGEVNAPGNYTLLTKEERISDVIKRAGGFSPYAYIKGASLIRKVNYQTEKEQKRLYDKIKAENDSLSENNSIRSKLLNAEEAQEFKIGIQLDEIMKPKGIHSKIDLILHPDDLLIIPSIKQTVEVSGQVLAPTLIRYDKSNAFLDYINSSGGFAEKAKKRSSYVIYANGDIRSTKNFLFFKFYPKIEPGAMIFVPEKMQNKDRMTIQEILGITTALSTLGVLINTFVK
ncbi:MAG: SLBB domain-containing protein [Bacteroidetes bacterium]|nr:SLBB domain-containing protein [Bacteroidota bacterium]